MDQSHALDALHAEGLAVVPLPPGLAPRLQLSLQAVRSYLRNHYHNGERVTQGCVAIAAFPERAQLRFATMATTDSLLQRETRSALERSVADGAAALSQVALGHLKGLKGAPTRAEPLLDAFWYPGSDGWSENHDGQPPAPCPAHTDPGLLTCIVDDNPGLEAYRSNGQWAEVAPTYAQCVIIAGRELEVITAGRIRACTHRVRPTTASRTSLVFELKLSAVDANRPSASLSPAAATPLGCTRESVDEKYARAANALLTRKPPAQRGDVWCAVM